MSKRKLVNNTIYPQYVIENIARCLFPDMQAFFASEEGQREFAEWKAEQQKRAAENSAALVVIAASSFLSVLWASIRGESPSHSQNRFSHTL